VDELDRDLNKLPRGADFKISMTQSVNESDLLNYSRDGEDLFQDIANLLGPCSRRIEVR